MKWQTHGAENSKWIMRMQMIPAENGEQRMKKREIDAEVRMENEACR